MYSELSKDTPVVQKYGGTSVGSVERIQAIAERVSLLRQDGWNKIAVVVSAMAGETNRVVELVKMINPNATARHYDMAVAAGEQVSSALMAAALEGKGVGSQAFLAYQIGLRTNGFHSQARIQSIDTDKIETCWKNGVIPVVAGFQGVNESMELTTLGRGGSDISAVALAVALKAGFCEINTDVDGVFTGDPRIIENARLVEVLDYESALEMAALGSKVLHSRCVELGAKFGMPIVVRNSFQENDARRTRIMSFSEKQALEAPAVSGVSLEKDIAKFSLTSLGKDSNVISEIFAAIAKRGINVDIIIQNVLPNKETMRLGFSVSRNDMDATAEVLCELKKRPALTNMRFTKRADLSKVSVVGLGMRTYAGVASRAFEALANGGIEIVMISTSEIKISCVVPSESGAKAAEILHRQFIEE